MAKWGAILASTHLAGRFTAQSKTLDKLVVILHTFFDSFHMTIATTDGESLHCARHASFGAQPSLYHSKPDLELQASSGDPIRLQKGAILVVSEPLDELAEDWQIVPESSRLVIKAGDAQIHSLST